MTSFLVTDNRRSRSVPEGPLPVPGVDMARHEATLTVRSFWEWADLCFCGTRGEMIRLIAGALEGCGTIEETGGRISDVALAYALDAWGLTDHGACNGHYWLTRDGERLRDALRLVDLDTVLHDESWIDVEARRWPGRVVQAPAWEPYE